MYEYQSTQKRRTVSPYSIAGGLLLFAIATGLFGTAASTAHLADGTSTLSYVAAVLIGGGAFMLILKAFDLLTFPVAVGLGVVGIITGFLVLGVIWAIVIAIFLLLNSVVPFGLLFARQPDSGQQQVLAGMAKFVTWIVLVAPFVIILGPALADLF